MENHSGQQYGHDWLLRKAVKDTDSLRVGIHDGTDYCMDISLKENKLVIQHVWNYSISSIYGINF